MCPANQRGLCAIFGLAAFACGGSDEGENLPKIPDSIPACDFSNRGVLNLWLLGHGLPPETGGVIPGPGTKWQKYSDPDIPLFSFRYPPGWTAYRLNDGVFAGFLIASPDGLSQLKFGSILATDPALTSSQIVDVEFDGLFGADATGVTACLSQGTTVTTVATDSSLAVIEAEGAIFLIGASVLIDTGIFGYGKGVAMNAAIRWVAAPEADFTRMTDEVFLPVLFQFYYGYSLEDGDGDGVPDVSDAEPDDPDEA